MWMQVRATVECPHCACQLLSSAEIMFRPWSASSMLYCNLVTTFFACSAAMLTVVMLLQDIHLTAYSPLGTPDSAAMQNRGDQTPHLMSDPTVKQIADKHGKHTAPVSAAVCCTCHACSVGCMQACKLSFP